MLPISSIESMAALTSNSSIMGEFGEEHDFDSGPGVDTRLSVGIPMGASIELNLMAGGDGSSHAMPSSESSMAEIAVITPEPVAEVASSYTVQQLIDVEELASPDCS